MAVARAGVALFLACCSIVVVNPGFGLVFRELDRPDWVAALLAGLAATALVAGSFVWHRIIRAGLTGRRHLLWAGLGIASGHAGFAAGFAFADILGPRSALVLLAASAS